MSIGECGWIAADHAHAAEPHIGHSPVPPKERGVAVLAS
jgi:hypothetical protein